MWIEAIVTEADCVDFVRSMTPLEVDLDGPNRRLVVSRPKRIELVPRKGLRLVTTGHVLWSIAGVHLPIKVRVASLMLMPTISKDKRLSLQARVEKLDVKVLPDFIDHSILHHINELLAKYDDTLSWKFGEMFTHKFPLPKAVGSAEAIAVRTNWGKAKITADAIVLAVSFDVRATKRPRRAEIIDAAE